MAKRYARVNWQNKPSTATPWSAQNLNIMDKGINDCDDAIELKIDKASIANNVVTTTVGTVLGGPQGKVLQDQITGINNNLAAYLMRGIVASGLIADVNLCTSKGTYEVFGSNADVSNLPTIEGTIYGILEVNVGNTGGAFMWQKLRTITGMEYNRYYVNGSWSTWT